MQKAIREPVLLKVLILQENDWYPGKKPTREELLEQEVIRLRRHIAHCEKQISDMSWQINPDRSGGQFDWRDYEQMKRSEQGIFG